MKRAPREPAGLTVRLTRKIINECRTIAKEAYDWSVTEWAEHAGVSAPTVYNLIEGRTRFVQLNTVVCLLDAVGLDLVLKTRNKADLVVKGHRKYRTTVSG